MYKKGYKQIFWGFIFLIFHINIGDFQILPTFVSYLIIYSGIKKVANQSGIKILNESLKCCGVVVLLSFIMETMSLINKGILIENPIFNIILISGFGILSMSMVYKLLLGSSEILKDKDSDLSCSYIKKATLYLIFESTLIIIHNISIGFKFTYLLLAIAILKLVLNIWIIILVNKMSKIEKVESNFSQQV